MPIVNMLEAKTQLSRLVESVELGEEMEIVIARNGRPAARLTSPVAVSRRQSPSVAVGRRPTSSVAVSRRRRRGSG